MKVISNSPHPGGVAELQLDPLQPVSFGIMRAHVSLDVIIMRPWAQLLDVILPMAVRVARQAVCCQVPHDYISGAQGPWRPWMAEKEAKKRVMLIRGPVVGPRLLRVLWLVVFRTAALREQCCKVEAAGCKSLSGGFQMWVQGSSAGCCSLCADWCSAAEAGGQVASPLSAAQCVVLS